MVSPGYLMLHVCMVLNYMELIMVVQYKGVTPVCRTGRQRCRCEIQLPQPFLKIFSFY